MTSDYLYDIALSFAGEDRPLVRRIADKLRDNGVLVFCHDFEEAKLWGKNLYSYLREIYRDRSRFTVVFCSQHYNKNLWTKHERESAQERALRESYEYILPVRLDDAEISSIPSTIAYLDLRKISEDDLVIRILEKLGKKRTKKKQRERRAGKHLGSNLLTGRSDHSARLGVLIVTYGSVATGLLESAEAIAGSLPKNFGALAFDWNQGVDDMVERIKSATIRLDGGGGVLILADMYGGAPYNAAAIATQGTSSALVSGVNLPMALRLAVRGEEIGSAREVARWLRAKVQRSLIIEDEMYSPDKPPDAA